MTQRWEASVMRQLQFLYLFCMEEIRNRIYDFACEDGIAEICLHHNTWNPKRVCQPCRTKFNTDRRSYFSLTQVCRTIRSEYRPLAMARTKIHVDSAETHRYLDAFVLAGGIKPARAVGNIVLLEGQCYHWDAPEPPTLIDFQPLITLHQAASRLSIKFDERNHRGFKGNLLNPLMSQDMLSAQLRNFLDHHISSVELCVAPYVDMCMHFSMKPLHLEQWMRKWPMTRQWHDMRDSGAMREWAESLDLYESLALHYIRFKVDES
ncbi:hypothetical protein T440DRAFT_246528 [Plenodomus tracheiphilus IPT5]|uniref:Uncharacterized protein n=1 Tax=Plenodomus tracheiphilus IPT5 TaxID=1408161 RepID=A0A6A7ASF5_9PLEO|nr:hypothetical protein T440DRAFT_246528 [Plenodomus tracheiphilus IPT5]